MLKGLGWALYHLGAGLKRFATALYNLAYALMRAGVKLRLRGEPPSQLPPGPTFHVPRDGRF